MGMERVLTDYGSTKEMSVHELNKAQRDIESQLDYFASQADVFREELSEVQEEIERRDSRIIDIDNDISTLETRIKSAREYLNDANEESLHDLLNSRISEYETQIECLQEEKSSLED